MRRKFTRKQGLELQLRALRDQRTKRSSGSRHDLDAEGLRYIDDAIQETERRLKEIGEVR